MSLLFYPLHYVIRLFSSPSRNEIIFNLLGDEDFTIPYVIDTIPNSSAVHQLPTQANKNVWIVDANGEEPITYQGAFDEVNLYQIHVVNPR